MLLMIVYSGKSGTGVYCAHAGAVVSRAEVSTGFRESSAEFETPRTSVKTHTWPYVVSLGLLHVYSSFDKENEGYSIVYAGFHFLFQQQWKKQTQSCSMVLSHNIGTPI